MPFRLFNPLANFQYYINKIVAKKIDIFITIYFDHILIYIKDLGQLYVEIVYWVFD